MPASNKIHREDLATLANELVANISCKVILTEDEEVELYDGFYEVLDDILASRE